MKVYMDDGTTSRSVKIRGLPTTFFIDANGQFIGFAEGAVNWRSQDVRDLIEKHLK
jgi:hypothetical protein